jgi:Co/Zn/Cd efflux system component
VTAGVERALAPIQEQGPGEGAARGGHGHGHGHMHGGYDHGHSHDAHERGDGHGHGDGGHGHGVHVHGHGHSHGLVDRSIMSSREGLRAVSWSLLVLMLTAAAQAAAFAASGSVALLADLVHNFGDALTAIPLGIAFLLRSFTAERRAGFFVVAAIFVSACVALWQSIARLIHPEHLHHLWPLAIAGFIGFAGNEIAARIRSRAGRRLNSPALIADGAHARSDAIVSLSVVATAVVVAVGLGIADPIIGLIITLVILRITWESLATVWRGAEGGRLEAGASAEVG